MKYIRTKDGKIIDTTAYDQVKQTVINGVLVGTQYLTASNSNDFSMIVAHGIYETDIINQADTIEELCDEFVVVIENKQHLIPREWLKQEIIVDVLYGAIWTDKGLIYVAKMNDKGELELL